VGEAKQSVVDLQAPKAPTWEQAVEASRSYLGFHTHSFPGCFVCGPARPGGLRIFQDQ
jgi:hypothetical protein